MSASGGTMRIGEVHAQLRVLYPDIELSKIRYYEDMGLVQPSRSRKGYRLYSERDVACLREAIRLAQEEFVPLRVVKLRLMEQGLLDPVAVTPATRQVARQSTINVISSSAPAPLRPAPTNTTPPALSGAPTGDNVAPIKEFFSTTELLATTGLREEELASLRAAGLVAPVTLNAETCYTALDVRVAALSRALFSRGVDVRLLGALRRVAEREVGIVDDMTAPLRGPGAAVAPDEARRVAADVAHEVAALRALLVERELNGYLRS